MTDSPDQHPADIELLLPSFCPEMLRALDESARRNKRDLQEEITHIIRTHLAQQKS